MQCSDVRMRGYVHSRVVARGTYIARGPGVFRLYKVLSEAILDHLRFIVAQNYSLTLKRL